MEKDKFDDIALVTIAKEILPLESERFWHDFTLATKFSLFNAGASAGEIALTCNILSDIKDYLENPPSFTDDQSRKEALKEMNELVEIPGLPTKIKVELRTLITILNVKRIVGTNHAPFASLVTKD